MAKEKKGRKEKALTASELYREFGEKEAPERKMGFFRTIRSVLFFPDHFFGQLERVQFSRAFGYLLKLAVVPGLWVAIAKYAYGGGLAESALAGFSTYLGILISAALSAAIVHLALKGAGAKKGFGETFKVGVFAGTPWFALSSAPIPSIFGLVWAIYLQTVGLSASQKVGKIPAFLATLLPILIWVGIVAYLVATYPEKFLEILNS